MPPNEMETRVVVACWDIMRTSYLFAQKQNITANKKRVVNFRFNFPFIDDLSMDWGPFPILLGWWGITRQKQQAVWRIFIENRSILFSVEVSGVDIVYLIDQMRWTWM